MIEHELKSRPDSFEPLWEGVSTAQFRADDREPRFEVGHIVTFAEWNQDDERYTGRAVVAKVSHLDRGPLHGIPKGCCVMSLMRLGRMRDYHINPDARHVRSRQSARARTVPRED